MVAINEFHNSEKWPSKNNTFFILLISKRNIIWRAKREYIHILGIKYVQDY